MPALTISAVDNATDQLTITAHGLVTGDGAEAIYSAVGTLPAPLAAVTDYWVIRVDANTIKLATSSANALAGTAINLTTNGSGTLLLLVGIPYRRARTYAAAPAPGSQVKSADLNSLQDALVATWNLLTGQAQSVFSGVTLTGQALFKARQVLTAGGGTYTPTVGARKCLLRWCGGGGGGGGAQNNTATGAGGASGESCEIWIDPGAPLTGGAFTNGAAGTAGVGGGANGGAGGDTTIVINGTTYTAKGGLGGTSIVAGAAPSVIAGGGAQTTGTYPQCTGNHGGPSIIMNNTGNALSGAGGSSLFGAGGKSIAAAAVGNAGTGKGAGGGGGMTSAAATNNGGAGTIGVIVIDEFF